MNRWRQRLAEINGDGAVTHDVQNVQNVQNSRPSRHFVQIEQIEQRAEASAPLLTTLASTDGDISDDWCEPLRRLLSRQCSEDVPAEHWACVCRGVKQFAQGWAAKAISLGWTFDELFAFVEPFANVSLQGAAWFVGDSTVTAVTTDAITLRTEGGATQRIYRNPRA
jgi:hypothetical protein